MKKRWLYRPTPQHAQVNALSEVLGGRVNSAICSLLVQKGITQFDQAKAYFRPSLEALHDPFIMKGMHKAVERLRRAITLGEPILVYGDYDVDGTTSVAMFYSYIKELGAVVDFYIPDRYTEGYGISSQAISWAASAGFKLIVSLDCGIRAVRCISEANDQAMDVIVCDHHEPGPELPAAYAILDPKQLDCPYPTKELSGCGVGFKLLQGLAIVENLPLARLYTYLDFVAVSIACDIVPIVGENRILAYHGMKQLNDAPRPGFYALMAFRKSTSPLEISQLVFGIGPRINAAGRMEHAKLAVDLLIAQHEEGAGVLAQQLNDSNNLRRDIDSATTEEALAMIRDSPHGQEAKTTVLFKEDWHKGVVGIVASRCIEQYYRPTIILTASQGKATGSVRSIDGYNVYEALHACADLLHQYGGHAHAAGLTLAVDKVPALQQRFEEVVASTISNDLLLPLQCIDLPLDFDQIDVKFYRVLNQMAPFGVGNMRPVFVTEPVIAQRMYVVQGKHLKLYVCQPDAQHQSLEAIGFGMADYAPLVEKGRSFKMAYTIEENSYMGRCNLQLNVKDLASL